MWRYCLVKKQGPSLRSNTALKKLPAEINLYQSSSTASTWRPGTLTEKVNASSATASVTC